MTARSENDIDLIFKYPNAKKAPNVKIRIPKGYGVCPTCHGLGTGKEIKTVSLGTVYEKCISCEGEGYLPKHKQSWVGKLVERFRRNNGS